PWGQETVAVDDASDVAPCIFPLERGDSAPLRLDRGFAADRGVRRDDELPPDVARRLMRSSSSGGGAPLLASRIVSAAGTEIGSMRPVDDANGRSAAMSSLVDW